MIKKIKEKEMAIELRNKEFSIIEISKILKVSKSSVSTWVRNVELSKEQLLNIKNKGLLISRKKVGSINRIKACKKRKIYQDNGKELAKITKDKEFVMGCMLYWAEGGKKRNFLQFCNTDVDMMIFFINFMRKYFDINEDKLSFNIQYYSNNGLSENDVELFWKSKLNLKDTQKRKCYIDRRSITNLGRKVGKCPYGVCRISYNDVKIVQMIYGAIKELVGINNDKWLY